jgi:hypothetical protein
LEKAMKIFTIDQPAKPVDTSAAQPVAAGTSAAPDSAGTFMGNTDWPVIADQAVIIEELVWSPADSGSTAKRRHWF